ncbi:MAG: glycosyltransferase family 4 protein [Deltaproteobacteria bacterium]|jgi:glycosyltransferase involved in cell wall biosynthesis|nr:glycosyltransferase family 4 protein [Deltaproteobacteria bacterium]MBW2543661.1 glycosyltransferase family 4 protein [Deltaproteobacteria bacterium]
MRIAILTNAPTPYRAPVFARIAATAGVEARVFFDSASGASAVDARPDYPHEFLRPAFHLRHRNYQDDAGWAERVSMGFALDYLPRLAAFRPNVIVSGEFGWRSLNAAVFARAAGIPLLVWWEGTRFTERKLGAIRHCARRGLSSASAGLLGFGKGSVEYLHDAVGARKPVHFVPQAVHNLQIAEATDRWRARRDSVREQLGARGVTLLCLSRQLPHKGIPQYTSALRRLAEAVPEGAFTALFAGEGPEAETIARASEDFPRAIRNLGKVSPSEIPRLFAASDLLVFPTLRDCWGMVVNEALAAGVPVLGSRYAGAARELLGADAVGCLIDPLVPASLDEALEAAVLDERWANPSPTRLRAALKGYSCEDAAEAILRAARSAVADCGMRARS